MDATKFELSVEPIDFLKYQTVLKTILVEDAGLVQDGPYIIRAYTLLNVINTILDWFSCHEPNFPTFFPDYLKGRDYIADLVYKEAHKVKVIISYLGLYANRYIKDEFIIDNILDSLKHYLSQILCDNPLLYRLWLENLNLTLPQFIS